MSDLLRRIVEMVSLGRLTVVLDDGGVQTAQVTDRRLGADGSPMVSERVQRVADFGFTSNPPLGSDAVVLRLAGDRSRALVVGTNHPASRLRNLAPGDAAIYDQRGAYVWLTSQGLVIDCAGLPARIRNCGKLRVEGDLEVTGEVRAMADTAPVALSTHKHPIAGPATGVPFPGGQP